MTSTLSFLAEHRSGIILLLLLLVVLCALLTWVLWMFGWGRFGRSSSSKESDLRFVVAKFFVKLINDFRHLLALLIIVLFSLALFAAMWPGMMKQDVGTIKQGLEGVAAALGGLIGSIIGYYFGESAGKSRLPGEAGQQLPQAPAEQDPSPNTGGIVRPTTKPPLSEK